MIHTLRARTALLLVPLLALACGGGGSSDSDDADSGDGGGGGGSGQVQFTTTGQNAAEVDGLVFVGLVLSSPLSHDVKVHYNTAGDAQAFGDYVVLTPSPVIIPELSQQAEIEVQIIADTKGELDEYVKFSIVAVEGADPGVLLTHDLTIVDDDGVPYGENEPNDDIANANFVGFVGKTKAFDISGAVTEVFDSDPYDVFLVQAEEDVTLDLCLDPLAAFALVKLTLTDPANNILDEFLTTGPGEPAGGTYDASAGENLYLWVQTEASLTAYFLDVVGLEFGLSEDGGPAPDEPGR